MFAKGGFEDAGRALRWWEDQLEGARTFQKGVFRIIELREEIINERRGRGTASARGLGKERGSRDEKMIHPANEHLNEREADKERMSNVSLWQNYCESCAMTQSSEIN